MITMGLEVQATESTNFSKASEALKDAKEVRHCRSSPEHWAVHKHVDVCLL